MEDPNLIPLFQARTTVMLLSLFFPLIKCSKYFQIAPGSGAIFQVLTLPGWLRLSLLLRAHCFLKKQKTPVQDPESETSKVPKFIWLSASFKGKKLLSILFENYFLQTNEKFPLTFPPSLDLSCTVWNNLGELGENHGTIYLTLRNTELNHLSVSLSIEQGLDTQEYLQHCL